MQNTDSLRPLPDADAIAYQNFIGAFRKLWAGPLYRHVRDQARALPHQDPEAFAAFDDALQALPSHQMFAWLEHNLQQMKYRGHYGMQPTVEKQRRQLEQALAAPLPQGLLIEAPDMVFPDYYEQTDFHQHPGGLREDPLAGVVYRESAGAAGGVVGKANLHARFVAAALGGRPARRVLDIGCGFGRGVFAFAASAPETQVVGVDLSSACLRLAAHLACARPDTDRLRFVQADAAALPPGEGDFDIASSAMLLHEMPADAIRAMTAEIFRALRPGGRVAHLDFLPPRDNFLRSLYYGHSDRNAEPHMRDLAGMDLIADHEAAGFTDVTITPFAEDDGPADAAWRLPWVIVSAKKPE